MKNILNQECENPILKVLISIRTDYLNKRFTFIEGRKMKEILRFLGASDEDFIKLEYSGNYLAPDPTLPFRMSRNGRFFLDFEERKISRLEFQPFVLSKEEDFVRDDSGELRYFRGIEDTIQQNKSTK